MPSCTGVSCHPFSAPAGARAAAEEDTLQKTSAAQRRPLSASAAWGASGGAPPHTPIAARSTIAPARLKYETYCAGDLDCAWESSLSLPICGGRVGRVGQPPQRRW